jgi:hypothetical protein
MTYQPEDHSLIIWRQKSNNIYTANGSASAAHSSKARLVFIAQLLA